MPLTGHSRQRKGALMSEVGTIDALLVHGPRGRSVVAARVTRGLEAVVESVATVPAAVELLRSRPRGFETIIVDLVAGGDIDVPELELIADASGSASLAVIGESSDPAIEAVVAAAADARIPRSAPSTVGNLFDVMSRAGTTAVPRSAPDDATPGSASDIYRTIVETSIDAMWMGGLEGTILFANARMAEILGLDPAALERRNILEFIAPSLELRAKAGFLRRRVGLSDVYDLCLCTDGGDDRWMLSTITPFRDAKDVPIAVISSLTDISEQRMLRRQLAQSRRMESIGRLAGGVAHDFNNLLTLIGGYATVLRGSLKEGSAELEHACEIERAAQQASALTRQLLTFSRQEAHDARLLDLNELVRTLETMLRSLLTEEVELVLRLDAKPGAVLADVSQLEQIVTNLCLNARDAMPDGGVVSIETETVALTNRADGLLGSGDPGHYVRMTVTDAGTGMDEATRQQMFDPFFTTKAPDKGTGLGLSTVYGIVEDHDGLISVESQQDRGTSIGIHLPCAASRDEAETAERQDGSASTTVLLIEDNDAVRALGQRILADAGYEVLEARVASEALEHADRHGPSIDLVISDSVIPGTQGVALVDQISQHVPDLPVVYVSGSAEEAVLGSGGRREKSIFLAKPFSPDDLLSAAGSLLEKR